MKAKIKIIQTSRQGNYKNLFLQILDNRYKNLSNASECLEPIGSIKFLNSIDYIPENWFSMEFICNTETPEHLLTMYKIAKLIKESDVKNPNQIITLLNADIYVSFQYEFLNVKLHGCNKYALNYINHDGEKKIYKYFYAHSETVVYKQVENYLQNNKHLNGTSIELIVENMDLKSLVNSTNP